MKEIVIIGGSFTGLKLISLLCLLKKNDHIDFKISLITKNKSFFFLPLLSDYICGKLPSLNNVKTPIEDFCLERNVCLYQDQAISLDKKSKKIFLSSGKKVNFDYLVIATGTNEESDICLHT